MDKLVSGLAGVLICLILSLVISKYVITPKMSECEDIVYEIVVDNERVCTAKKLVMSKYVDYDYYRASDDDEYVTDGVILTHIKDGIKTTITGSWAIRVLEE